MLRPGRSRSRVWSCPRAGSGARRWGREDVLTLVREGELLAVGTGVAPPEAPSTLYRGDAVRFASPSDGLLLNLTDRPTRAVVAFVRGGESVACRTTAPAPSDPFVRPLRTTSVRTTEPLVTLGGRCGFTSCSRRGWGPVLVA